MNTWYRVEINGRCGGEAKTVKGTIYAQSARDAAYEAVHREFDDADDLYLRRGYTDDNGCPKDKILFGWEYSFPIFYTEHDTFDDMAQAASPAAVAWLTGHTTLPLEDF